MCEHSTKVAASKPAGTGGMEIIKAWPATCRLGCLVGWPINLPVPFPEELPFFRLNSLNALCNEVQ